MKIAIAGTDDVAVSNVQHHGMVAEDIVNPFLTTVDASCTRKNFIANSIFAICSVPV